jgi:ribonuclease HII
MNKYVIGIDEVGRGALAGPVAVAAALIKGPRAISTHRELGKLKDSKKLSPKQRAAWFSYFKDDLSIEFSVARVYPRRIGKMNISCATNLAALRACDQLIKNHGPRIKNVRIFLDGGLFLGKGIQPANARTVVKGDEKIPAIAVASIIAKVTRDRFMVRLAKKYPAYGFEMHKGYGTKAHYKALRRDGPSPAHRLTFIKKILY